VTSPNPLLTSHSPPTHPNPTYLHLLFLLVENRLLVFVLRVSLVIVRLCACYPGQQTRLGNLRYRWLLALGSLFGALLSSFGSDRRYVFEGSTTSNSSTELQESNNGRRTQEEPDRDRHPPPNRFCFPPDDLPTDLDSSPRLAIRFPPLHHSSRTPLHLEYPSCLSRLTLALGPLARLLSSSSIRDVRCSSPFIQGDERDGGVVRQDPNLIRALIGTFVGRLFREGGPQGIF